jgi:hypothetical protein
MVSVLRAFEAFLLSTATRDFLPFVPAELFDSARVTIIIYNLFTA